MKVKNVNIFARSRIKLPQSITVLINIWTEIFIHFFHNGQFFCLHYDFIFELERKILQYKSFAFYHYQLSLRFLFLIFEVKKYYTA